MTNLSIWLLGLAGSLVLSSCSGTAEIHETTLKAIALQKSGSRQQETGTVASADGTRIFYRVWAAESSPSKAIIVIHGIGYQSEPYNIVADYLAAFGYLTVGTDLRGHGHSGGPRGLIGTPEEIVDDLDAVFDHIKQSYGPTVLFLLGDSMGGLVALNYAAISRKTGGLILAAPALEISWQQLLKLETLKILPRLFLGRQTPVIDLIGSRLDEATADEEFKRQRRADALALPAVSINYLLGLNRLISGWEKKAASVEVPTLILHGKADRIWDWRGSQNLHDALGSKTKRLVLLNKARHTLFWDPATPVVFAEILDWLRRLEF